MPDRLLARLSHPRRDALPGRAPILPLSALDDEADVAAVHAAARRTLALSRRGRHHGEWAELDPARLGAGPWSEALEDGAAQARWSASRPIVLAGVARDALPAWADVIAARAELQAELAEPGGLARWLARAQGDLPPGLQRLPGPQRLADPERDLERVAFESLPPGPRGRRIRDLWVKSSWLSTFDGDESLRLRVSFGREGWDDASPDLLRQRLVADLARALLPECALVEDDPRLVGLVERCAGEPVLFTQPIAYWNAEEGGALLHHDAFAEDRDETGRPLQRGVVYLQLSGATAWIALSTADLAARVGEFVERLAAGELPWVRAQLFETPAAWEEVRALAADPAAAARELALPGQGRLGRLAGRGPEFTGFLAERGHAWLLDAGDAILLPNHGPLDTALHSVFCAGDETGYALSLAVRADRAPAGA